MKTIQNFFEFEIHKRYVLLCSNNTRAVANTRKRVEKIRRIGTFYFVRVFPVANFLTFCFFVFRKAITLVFFSSIRTRKLEVQVLGNLFGARIRGIFQSVKSRAPCSCDVEQNLFFFCFFLVPVEWNEFCGKHRSGLDELSRATGPIVPEAVPESNRAADKIKTRHISINIPFGDANKKRGKT